MTRIQIWADNLWPQLGGIEWMTQLLATSFQARGHQIEMVALGKEGQATEEVVDGIPIYRLTGTGEGKPLDLDAFVAAVAGIRQATSRFQPEIQLLMQPHTVAPYHRLAHKANPVPVVFALCGRIEEFWSVNDSTGIAMRSCDSLVSCSQVVLDAALQFMPEVAPRAETILNAVPLPDLEPAPLPWDAPHFLSLGRLGYQKNVDLAILAFRRIAPLIPQARLTIAGDGPDGGWLRQMVTSLGLDDRIKFIGRVATTDVHAVINQATAVLMPSRFEGLPLVAIEAMQMARPLLATRVDGIMEAVVDGETGLLFEVGDDAGMADAMLRLLKDREAATAMGQTGRRRALSLFDWEQCLQAYETLFERLSAEKARR